MRFTRIEIDKKLTEAKGIDEINISRLSNLVALVGKNGSGKTRILDLLEENIFKSITLERLLDKSVIDLPSGLKNLVKKIEPFKEYILGQEKIKKLNKLLQHDPNNSNIINQINTISTNPQSQLHPNNRAQVRTLASNIEAQIEILKLNYLRRIKYSDVQILQEAINPQPNDSTITFENLIENVSENNAYDEFSTIHKSGLKYLIKLPHQLTLDFIECMGDKEKYESRISHKRYLSLKKLVKDFLNKDLTWEKKSMKNVLTETGVQGNYSGIWKLDNRLFNYAEFSDGEKTLFSYALLFFLIDANPKLNIKSSVILVDEPELHLHPDSEIDLITGMRNAIGGSGQLIFATHSINILSSLNYDEIFMVKNGVIKHPSQTTIGESLSELMGLEDRVNKLSDFLSSIATWTFVNFMTECFTNPEVIESARPDDPQLIAFKKAVLKNASEASSMLLDFGAGKGRVFEQIKLDYEFLDKINYSALEINHDFHSHLKDLGAENVYTSHTELPSKKFDFILLCNVLHEIPINEWVNSLNGIYNSLTDNGYLLIIEAKVLTKGEKIGEEGFILLDLEELKVLFGLSKQPTSIKINGKKDLIMCAVLSKSELRPVDNQILLKTLKALQENTLKKIIALRKSSEAKNDAINAGRKNAFLSQLHINSQLAQIKLENGD